MSASQVQQEQFISNALPSREETQAKLDLRSVAASRIKPTQEYTLADRLEAQVDRFSDRDFLVYGGQRFSYREVDERANQYANTFLARGIQPGDVISRVGRTAVGSAQELDRELRDVKPGQTVMLLRHRGGGAEFVAVTLRDSDD